MKYALRENSGRVMNVVESDLPLDAVKEKYDSRFIVMPLSEVPGPLVKDYEARRLREEEGATPLAKRKTTLFMEKHGIKAREVRVWATRQGYEVPARGAVPMDVLQKYQRARAARERRRGIPY